MGTEVGISLVHQLMDFLYKAPLRLWLEPLFDVSN
jgi:hypothetical protein